MWAGLSGQWGGGGAARQPRPLPEQPGARPQLCALGKLQRRARPRADRGRHGLGRLHLREL